MKVDHHGPEKGALKEAIKDWLPVPVLLRLHRLRRAVSPSRRVEHGAWKAQAQRTAETLAPLGLTVHSGPFAGMRLPRTPWGTTGPYLLGSYEEELHGHLERLLAKRPPLVVNVGAGAGYYAVGIARRLQKTRVVASDINSEALRLCRELASLNGVADRVETRRSATTARLQRWLRPSALVISDCEGCELGLLNPLVVPALVGVDLIVELHDFIDPTISKAIVARFAPTHTVTIVESLERDPSVRFYPALAKLPREEWKGAVDEYRPGQPDATMCWAVLERRA